MTHSPIPLLEKIKAFDDSCYPRQCQCEDCIIMRSVPLLAKALERALEKLEEIGKLQPCIPGPCCKEGKMARDAVKEIREMLGEGPRFMKSEPTQK